MLLYPDTICKASRSSKVTFHDEVDVDTTTDSFTEEELKPVNGLKSGPYKFVLKGKSNGVIDLERTLLDIKFKITKADGVTGLAAGTSGNSLTVAGNPISSMWERIESRINDKIINVEASRNIPQKGFIEDCLLTRFDERARPKGVREFKTVGDQRNETTFHQETGKFVDAKVVQYVGKPPIDFFKVNRYLSPRCNMSVTFFKQPDDYIILHAAEAGCKVVITDIKLHIRRINVDPSLVAKLPQERQDVKELYGGKCGIVKEYQIPKGSVRWVQPMILGNGKVPKYVVFGLVSMEGFAGGDSTSKRDPCYFDTFDMDHLSLRVGEKQLPRKPYSPDRLDHEHAGAREYFSLFDQLGLPMHYINMTRHAHGYNLHAFNLTPDMRSYTSQQLVGPRRAPMTVEIGFGTALPETVVLVAYMVYDQVISITGPTGFPIEEQF